MDKNRFNYVCLIYVCWFFLCLIIDWNLTSLVNCVYWFTYKTTNWFIMIHWTVFSRSVPCFTLLLRVSQKNYSLFPYLQIFIMPCKFSFLQIEGGNESVSVCISLFGRFWGRAELVFLVWFSLFICYFSLQTYPTVCALLIINNSLVSVLSVLDLLGKCFLFLLSWCYLAMRLSLDKDQLMVSDDLFL